MNENEFWSIIGMLNWEESGDDEAVVEPVVDLLSQKSDEEIFQFEEILAQKLHALDTKAHAKEIGEDAYVNEKKYFSVDSFLYSRCVVVANGKELFQHILENPKEFPKDMEFEAILYVAQEAYEQKNDKEWEYVSPTDYETYKNISGWQ
ncbi:hypothetical protein BTA51_14870 [Hahella sp. CCB-MM4]|uniref:DUF4240 domain-containing protein n=1 Tax=Hahella sp. (strain CCB-MM4) TaxID=1926491 RepID=UPI000B9AD516|nr:DUF4240 domain-containing protein [Hahella sp. CCB-MM4]OZG72411.1 hypothetical protein BTA51_14870 [Hahella sp. CCB-MM4]